MKLLSLALVALLVFSSVHAEEIANEDASILHEVEERGGPPSSSSNQNFCPSGDFILQSCNNQLQCSNNYYSRGRFYDVIPYSPYDSPYSVPSNPGYTLQYELKNIYGRYIHRDYTSFEVWLRSTLRGSYVTAKFYYDWNGDGVWDRTETYEITSVSSSSWNRWYANAWKLRARSGTNYQDFRNGRFKAVFWQPYSSNYFNRGGHDDDDDHPRGGNHGGHGEHGGNQGGNEGNHGGHGGNQGGGNHHGGPGSGGNNNYYNQVWILTDRPYSGQYSLISLPYSGLTYKGQRCSSNYPFPYSGGKN